MSDAYDPGDPKTGGYFDTLTDRVPSREQQIIDTLEAAQ